MSRKSELYRRNRSAADLIFHAHNLEKGLSVASPHPGFGHGRLGKMLPCLSELQGSDSAYHREACLIATDAIREYIAFHENKAANDSIIASARTFLEGLNIAPHPKEGGTIELKRSDLDFHLEDVEKLFNTRHSIRDFDSTEVDVELLKKALRLAQRAPSACNRQAYRAYIFGKEKKADVMQLLRGVMGGATGINQCILITAKMSAYRQSEPYQYIVSASMYAAYLTLTLHAYGMGACLVQRSVIQNEKWETQRKEWGIAEDEQIICLVAVGNLKEACRVPVSHRLCEKEMIRWIGA